MSRERSDDRTVSQELSQRSTKTSRGGGARGGGHGEPRVRSHTDGLLRCDRDHKSCRDTT